MARRPPPQGQRPAELRARLRAGRSLLRAVPLLLLAHHERHRHNGARRHRRVGPALFFTDDLAARSRRQFLWCLRLESRINGAEVLLAQGLRLAALAARVDGVGAPVGDGDGDVPARGDVDAGRRAAVREGRVGAAAPRGRAGDGPRRVGAGAPALVRRLQQPQAAADAASFFSPEPPTIRKLRPHDVAILTTPPGRPRRWNPVRRGPEVSLGSPRVGTRRGQAPTPHARRLPSVGTYQYRCSPK